MKRLLLVALALAGCTTPLSSQGTSGQGGAVTAPPLMVTVNIGTGGGIASTLTSAPTAAPSASSASTSAQTATTDTRPSLALGDKAIEAAVPLLGAADVAKKVVEPPK